MIIFTNPRVRLAGFFTVMLAILAGCTYQSENVVPELILDVPDEIKPEMQNIILRVVADDMFPIEVDLTKQNEEFLIPTGKKRSITAIVMDARQVIRATGRTVNNISRRENQVTLNLFIPPAAPQLASVTSTGKGFILSWTAYVPRSGSEFGGYRIYRDNLNKVTEASPLLAFIKDQADTTLTDDEIVQGQDYFYCVYVFEKSGAFNISNCEQVLWQKNEDQPAL